MLGVVPRALAQAELAAPVVASPEAAAPAVEPVPTAGAVPSAEPAPPTEPVPSDTPQLRLARSVVERAEALFRVGDYGAALAEYGHAYELLAGDPRQGSVLNNLAVCHERLFHYDLALSFYERYLREYPTTVEDRAQVEGVMQSLRGVLGTLRVSASGGASVWLDDREVGQTPLELQVPAGAHVIELRAKGYEPERRELRVTARAAQTLHVVLTPLPTYRGLDPAFFWTGAALTGAALITGAAFGVAALNEDAAGEDQSARGLIVDGEPARDLALRADIAFAAGAALGVGSTVLFFLTDWKGAHSDERAAGSTQVRVLAGHGVVGAGFAGVLP